MLVRFEVEFRTLAVTIALFKCVCSFVVRSKVLKHFKQNQSQAVDINRICVCRLFYRRLLWPMQQENKLGVLHKLLVRLNLRRIRRRTNISGVQRFFEPRTRMIRCQCHIFGQSQITDLKVTIVAQENVTRLNITMYNVHFVDMLQTENNLLKNLQIIFQINDTVGLLDPLLALDIHS